MKLKTYLAATFSCLALSIAILASGGTKASAASAWDYNPGNIMSDAVMRNYNSMDVGAIQSFLKSKNDCNDTRTYIAAWYPTVYYHIENGHFVCMADESFNGKSAAQIIYQAAQDYHINPQVLIVLLQKEQGLVTDTYPHNYQYRSATGYGCPDTSACESSYYGFENQIRNAANLFNTVLNGGWTNYPVGWRHVLYSPHYECGGSTIYIENLATSALYRYTPYQPNDAAKNAGYGTGDWCSTYGNRNFFLYFSDWFGSTQNAPVAPQPDIPIGRTGWLDMLIPRKMIMKQTSMKYHPGTDTRSVNLESGQIIDFAMKMEITLKGKDYTCLRTRHDVTYGIDACILMSEMVEHPGVEPEPITPIYRRLANNARKYIPGTSITLQILETDQVLKYSSKIKIGSKTYYRTEHDTVHNLYRGVYSGNLRENIFIDFKIPRNISARLDVSPHDVFTGALCPEFAVSRNQLIHFGTKIYYNQKWYYRPSSDTETNCVFNPYDLLEVEPW